ncbi:MAG: hypothetical protein WC464_02845 [Bdellovibrionales bacterium]
MLLQDPTENFRNPVQDYQVLCNAEDGTVFSYPAVEKGEVRQFTPNEMTYLENINLKKIVAFEYETGLADAYELIVQIKEARLSPQEIMTVVNAVKNYERYSSDDIYTLKELLENNYAQDADLMAWVNKAIPSRPSAGIADAVFPEKGLT